MFSVTEVINCNKKDNYFDLKTFLLIIADEKNIQLI